IIAFATLKLVAFERNRNDDGLLVGFFRGLLQPEHLTHAAEIDNSVDSGGECHDIFDGTVDFQALSTDKQDTARTDVPGGPGFVHLIRARPDDFHRKLDFKSLSPSLLNHVIESNSFPLESQWSARPI